MTRIFDVLLAGLALLLLSPLLLIAMAVLRFTGEGEVFYVQQRVGKDGRRFGLLKFVTMVKNSPNMTTGTVTVKDDPRILPVGHFFRKTKINELPQLINILRGDMSIIGPRPQAERCFAAFPLDVQHAITKVRPGLSGIGSIVFRDEEELLHNAQDDVAFYDRVIAPYKGALEKWYIENQGLATYFLLIFTTAWVVVSPTSRLVWRLFSDLPQPPPELAGLV